MTAKFKPGDPVRICPKLSRSMAGWRGLVISSRNGQKKYLVRFTTNLGDSMYAHLREYELKRWRR